MYLLDTNREKMTGAAEIFGCDESSIGQLLTPLTCYHNYDREVFAIDNGAYAGFYARAFFRLLDREMKNQARCKFVAVPDVVGSAIRTLELFHHFAPLLRGWPLALVFQNGQEHLPIPWSEIKAVFIGGEPNVSGNEWKTSPAAAQIIRTAQALGKWVHVGRVNEKTRVRWCIEMGLDSVDGSGLSRFTNEKRGIHLEPSQKLFVE